MKHRQPLRPKPLEHPPAARLSPAAQPGPEAVLGRKAGVSRQRAPRNILQESLQLQKQLRRLTHQVLAAQENERLKISHKLQDEIAQTLLGINVRLVLLKQAAQAKTLGLKNEFASAQRLVVKSTELVRQLARELRHHQPTPSELTVTTI